MKEKIRIILKKICKTFRTAPHVASQKEINEYSFFAKEFFNQIIPECEEYFISDESSIWDFVFDETLDVYYQKIKELYGVDVSDTNGNFLGIFKKIETTREIKDRV